MSKMTIGRPIAATFILAVLTTLACASVTFAWLDFASAQTELQGKADLLEYRVQPGANSAGAETADLTLAITSDTETLAAAEFDAKVRSTASEAGALVLSTRAEAKRDDKDAADQIEVNASLEGTNDVLQDTLFQLESGTPLILVDGLTIRPAEGGAAVADSQPRLHAELILRGYWGGRK